MNLPNPIQKSGPGKLQEVQATLNQLIDYVRSLRPMPSQTVRPNHTAVGITYEAQPNTVQQTSTDTPAIVASQLGVVYRGEFSIALPYYAQDLVTVTGGSNGGTWIATEDIAPNMGEPGLSAGWVKVGEALNESFWQ